MTDSFSSSVFSPSEEGEKTDIVSSEEAVPADTVGKQPMSRGLRWRKAFGLIATIIGVIWIIAAPMYGFGTLNEPDPGIFPFAAGILLTAAGIAILASKENSETRAVVIPTLAKVKKPAILMGIFIAYVASLSFLGMFLSSWLMVIAVGILQGQRTWWKLLLAATAIVGVTRYVFVTLLRVPLSDGVLSGLLW